jgi:hypothetical protein
MGAVIVAGLALLAIAFLAVFFVELCKEKRRTRVKLILTTADGEASGKIRSNLLVLPSRRTATLPTPVLVRNVQRRTK